MKKLILNPFHTQLLVNRLAEQLVEDHSHFDDSLLIGLQPKGVFFLELIKRYLNDVYGIECRSGILDITFFRDDFRRKDLGWNAKSTSIDFLVEGKRVILIDDVLFTGRSVRAAFDAIISFGRPSKVQLMVLVDRVLKREFPIAADYVGIKINTLSSEVVEIDWSIEDSSQISVWINQVKS